MGPKASHHGLNIFRFALCAFTRSTALIKSLRADSLEYAVRYLPLRGRSCHLQYDKSLKNDLNITHTELPPPVEIFDILC